MFQPAQPLAVLAQACRFPGADSPDAFWHNLANGIATIQEVPSDRWLVEQLYAPPPYQPGKSVTKWGAFLADIQRFDAAFFNIPAAEAQIMDPQERILLELAYETFARAGYDAEQRKGLRIGVFLGIGQNGYNELVIPLLHSGQPTHPMLVAHNIRNLVAGQIAHTLNLNGPALVVDTACSSSLVALHIARQNLLTGECDLALVGGINLNITATPFIAFSSAGVLAPSPHTYIFDERANGFVLGEGGGMLLLRTLAQATAANDPILGLIRGSAINNDGHTLGPMTPSPHGQEAVLHAAYTAAGVPPESISYLEAHATGTRVGDVVEARALTRCFPKPPLNGVRYLGAVKPNVGHLLSAAAMPGLHKVLLAFQHRQLPPTLHGEQVRPIFKFDQAGITINRTLVDWMPAAPDLPLRAGVSSFGFGGTNAHVILEEPPALARHPRQLAHYTFAHTPFWIENRKDRGQKTDDSGQQTEATIKVVEKVTQLPPVMPDIDRWLQRVIWEEAAIGDSTHRAPCKTWLVLAVATPAAQALAERLTHHLQGQGLIAAYHCCRTGDEVDLEGWSAAQEAEWGLLFVGPVGLVQPHKDQGELAAVLAKELFPFHRIGQQLATRTMVRRPTGLWVVTAGAHSLENDMEAIAPDRASLAGFAFAINDEIVEIHCKAIDLMPSATVEIQVAQVTAELAMQPARAVIAWRQRQGRWRRLVRQLGPLPVDAAVAIPASLPKGVYLITGGATGIGAAVARSLAGLGMKLVLTGRTPLTRDPKRAVLITELRKAGATVEYVVADIAQANEVTVLFDYICQSYGPPVGVIHAAGIVRPQPLRSKTWADVEAVLAPKVAGAWLLAQELQRRAIKPVCLVLFSSIAAIVPGVAGGLSDYAAANAFLDALAAAQRQQGIACTVINWSIWAETGMGAQPTVLHHLQERGVAALTTAEGISAFYRALTLDEGQVVVYKPQSAPTTIPLPTPPQLGEGTVDATTVPPPSWGRLGGGAVTLPAQPPTTPLVMTTRRIDEIEATLQALLATVLKVAPAEVAKGASFMNLGIDSMDALDLVQKLENAGFHGLPATLFFEYQTITDLAHYLANQSSPVPDEPVTHPSQPQSNPAPSESVTRPSRLLPNDPPETADPLPHLHSPIQRAFAINHRLDPDRPAVAFLRQTIQGTLHSDLLQQAVQQVATRHALLRTRFTPTNTPDLLAPTVCAADDLTIVPRIAVTNNRVNTAALTAWEDRFINQPFDLATGCPWRIALLADPEQPDQWHLLLAIHHIAGDAWSLRLVAHELWAFYTALCQGRTLDLTIPPNPFHTPHTQQPEPTTLSWWRQQLAHYAPTESSSLPFDHAPDALRPDEWDKTRYAAHATHLTAGQSAALLQLAATHNLSLFHLTLALYLRALQQWSAANHLIVNIADAQRPPHLPGVMAMVGSFADTLPLALTLEPGESALALAERVRQSWLTIQQHKTVSSLDLAQLLAEIASTSATHQPAQLTPLGFSFARFEANPPVDCPVNITSIFGRTATPTMRLTLVGWEYGEELHFSWNYITPLFQQKTITALADHFKDQVTQLLCQQPATFVPVTALVQAQCQRTPAAIAVWENGDALTYAELGDRSTQLATALHTLNTDCAPVGLVANPSVAAIQLLLGIATAGAAWVPLDPAHPPARQADQLAQAGTRLLVFPTELAATAEAIHREMAGAIQLYSLDDLLRLRRGTNYRAPTQPEQVAYIIFTSGSTGRPKGVPITHGALANYIRWAVDTFGYGPTDRVMQATSLCFDASIRQIFAPLVTGGTVVPVERERLSDPQALRHFLWENRITIWSSVPALWARLLGALESNADADTPSSLPDLRWIQVGGEALSTQLVRRWVDLMGDRQRIANLYGPTETTINATCYIMSSRPAATETQIPIGYPIRGAQLQVCDENGQPCPPGAIGELWIGGAGLSPGYLHDPARTTERFMTLPTGERFYRSGDRVQQQANGALRFLGRLDEQVKVRGYRIELGEIEAVLVQHPGVRLAAVITRPADGDEQILVAYLECTGTLPAEEAVRQWLQARLPDYMLPHQIYATLRLPQMPNGKIDRQTLISGTVETVPLPRSSNRSAPQTSTEQLLAQVWGTVLKLDSNNTFIAREDDFFALGGDSLRAIQLFVELGKVRPVLPRPTYLYRYRTLAALAQAIDGYQPPPTTVTPTGIGEEESFGVSLAQAGFLLARALHETQATTWCARFALEGPLQTEPFLVTRQFEGIGQ
ncbi:MAG: amino acid adenylation domain-containing protein [Caldilineaceae bacterium]